MKVWNFNVQSNPKEISKKLESALRPVDGFVLHINHDKNNSVTFKLRKRILYIWYILFQNMTLVNGKLSKSATDNKTAVEISFKQPFLVKLILFTHLFIGLGFLIAIISGISSSASIYILGGVLIAVGIALWIAVQKKFEKDIQKYKALISEIVAS